MNFCKFYNNSMNFLESIEYRFLESPDTKRDNVKSKNVITGIFTILLYVVLLFLCIILWNLIFSPIMHLKELTTSKCEKKE